MSSTTQNFYISDDINIQHQGNLSTYILNVHEKSSKKKIAICELKYRDRNVLLSSNLKMNQKKLETTTLNFDNVNNKGTFDIPNNRIIFTGPILESLNSSMNNSNVGIIIQFTKNRAGLGLGMGMPMGMAMGPIGPGPAIDDGTTFIKLFSDEYTYQNNIFKFNDPGLIRDITNGINSIVNNITFKVTQSDNYSEAQIIESCIKYVNSRTGFNSIHVPDTKKEDKKDDDFTSRGMIYDTIYGPMYIQYVDDCEDELIEVVDVIEVPNVRTGYTIDFDPRMIHIL